MTMALVPLVSLQRIVPGKYFRSGAGLVGLSLGPQPRAGDTCVLIAPQRIYTARQKSFAQRQVVWNRHALVQPL